MEHFDALEAYVRLYNATKLREDKT